MTSPINDEKKLMAELGRVHAEMAAWKTFMPVLCGAAQSRMKMAALKKEEARIKARLEHLT